MLDQYHYQTDMTPIMKSHFDHVFRRTVWVVKNRDGSRGKFVSWWIGNFQLYHGSSKCDGSESITAHTIIMVDKPSELFALRYRKDGPGYPQWDNMGGS
jgi:hypothetical protein